MQTNLIARLNYMRDLGPSESEEISRVVERVRDVLDRDGFQRLDTPVLEPTGLFVRKSGGEISSSLYSFQDPGGMSVSLRPEFTPSIIRWFIENMSDESRPQKYQYSGPVFRYAGPSRGRFRQFHQVGSELIGLPGADGDAEILATAVSCLRSAGMPSFTLRLGHIGMIQDVIDSQGLSSQVKQFIFSNLDKISAGRASFDKLTESAMAAGLVVKNRDTTAMMESFDKYMPELEVVRHSISGPTGRRSPSQIMSRLSGRMMRVCSLKEFALALDSVFRLVSLSGSAAQVTEKAENILKSSGASLRSARALEMTLSELGSRGVPESAIKLDLSFMRGLTYYTGIVFEFLTDASEGEYPIGGGG